MKEKIIWYILYAIVATWLILSLWSIKDDYAIKVNERMDSFEEKIDEKIRNDDAFLENADIYKNSLNAILINQDVISGQIYDISQRLDQWEAE